MLLDKHRQHYNFTNKKERRRDVLMSIPALFESIGYMVLAGIKNLLW